MPKHPLKHFYYMYRKLFANIIGVLIWEKFLIDSATFQHPPPRRPERSTPRSCFSQGYSAPARGRWPKGAYLRALPEGSTRGTVPGHHTPRVAQESSDSAPSARHGCLSSILRSAGCTRCGFCLLVGVEFGVAELTSWVLADENWSVGARKSKLSIPPPPPPPTFACVY